MSGKAGKESQYSFAAPFLRIGGGWGRDRVSGDTWGGATWHDQGLPHGTMGEGHMA